MEIKRKCQFLLDKEPGKTDAKLRYRIKYAGHIVAFSVGYRVDIEKWNTETQRCKANTTNRRKQTASEINKEIQRLETLMDDVFKAWEVQEEIPTPDQLRESFNAANRDSLGLAPVVVRRTLFEYFDEFTKEQGKLNDWTSATVQKFAALRAHLWDFDRELTFEVLSESKLTEWVGYLKDNCQMRNSTIGKQLGFLKWFLRWATKKGYNTNTSYSLFAPKLKSAEKKIIFLDWDELMTVYHYPIPESKKYLQRVRDVFCFCCFTSLRYSDVENLRKSDIYVDHIEVTTMKTSDSLRIDLNKYSRSILEKYQGASFPNDRALPVISNQRMNEYLRELGAMCGLDSEVTITYYRGNKRYDEIHKKYELLTTHAGRRTFICNALSMGIPAEVVMKWTGHSDYKAMKPYIDVADRIKAEAMSKFDER